MRKQFHLAANFGEVHSSFKYSPPQGGGVIKMLETATLSIFHFSSGLSGSGGYLNGPEPYDFVLPPIEPHGFISDQVV